jgi:hypothetical protein
MVILIHLVKESRKGMNSKEEQILLPFPGKFSCSHLPDKFQGSIGKLETVLIFF